ncbi:MAG: DUF4062 domain-containing protein [Acidobacteriota bacterium]
MRGRSVFVSSRMDELAFERQAVFDALYRAGLQPLMFEVEPTGRSEKTMIDHLVDRSNFFLGIYYQSLGSPSRELYGLEPIVYELYRFLLRHVDQAIAENIRLNNGTVTKGTHEKLNALLTPPNGSSRPARGVEALNEKLRNNDSELQSVMADKVKFFQKDHLYDWPMSASLAKVLQYLPKENFRSRDEDFPHSLYTPSDFKGDVPKRYVTSRLDLFDKTSRWAENVMTGLDSIDIIPPSDDQTLMRSLWRIDANNYPGAIYQILRIVFNEGFNIEWLHCGPLDKDGVKVPIGGRIDFIASPFYDRFTEGELAGRVSNVTKEIEKLGVKSTPEAIRLEKLDYPVGRKLPALPSGIGKDSTCYYAVAMANVPGQVLRLAEKIFFFHATIDYIHVDQDILRIEGPPEGGVNVTLVAISGSDSAEDQVPFDRTRQLMLEMELRQGLGCAGVEPMTKEKFEKKLADIQGECKAQGRTLAY